MSIIKVDTVSNTGGTKSISVDDLAKVDSGVIKDLDGNIKGGRVLQTVYSGANDIGSTNFFSTSSTSFTATGLSVSITPKRSDSILIITVYTTIKSDDANYAAIPTVYKDGVNLGGTYGFSYIKETGWENAVGSFITASGSTSSKTFEVYL